MEVPLRPRGGDPALLRGHRRALRPRPAPQLRRRRDRGEVGRGTLEPAHGGRPHRRRRGAGVGRGRAALPAPSRHSGPRQLRRPLLPHGALGPHGRHPRQAGRCDRHGLDGRAGGARHRRQGEPPVPLPAHGAVGAAGPRPQVLGGLPRAAPRSPEPAAARIVSNSKPCPLPSVPLRHRCLMLSTRLARPLRLRGFASSPGVLR